jgi:hypothetical protein
LQGPAGKDGVDGATGATGAKGDTGSQGIQGATGAAGTAGKDGAAGATGPQGIQGATGAQGPAGKDGVDGATGATGAAGTAGKDGATGATGATGAAGASVTPITQAAWYIDMLAGNDTTGTGAVGAPLATDIELAKRWGAGATIAIAVTVTYVNSPAAETNYDVTIAAGGSFKILGVASSTTAVAISAVTAQNRATAVCWDITATGLGATHVGKIIAIPAKNAYATVLKNLTGGKVRVSQFISNAVNTTTWATNVTPVVGDQVVVHTLPTIQVGRIRAMSKTSANPTSTTNCVIVDLVTLQGASSKTGELVSEGVAIFAQRVVYDGITVVSTGTGTVYAAGGSVVNDITVRGQVFFWATGCIGSTLGNLICMGGCVVRLWDCLFQGVCCMAKLGADVMSFGCGYFDSTSVGAVLVLTGAVYAQNGATADWGSGNSGDAIYVQTTGAYFYVTKPTIAAATGPVYLAGTRYAYAAVPVTNNLSFVGFLS